MGKILYGQRVIIFLLNGGVTIEIGKNMFRTNITLIRGQSLSSHHFCFVVSVSLIAPEN